MTCLLPNISVIRNGSFVNARDRSSSVISSLARTWEIEVGSTTELNEWMETFTILALVIRCQTFLEKEVRDRSPVVSRNFAIVRLE